jgi:hypothetical protein
MKPIESLEMADLEANSVWAYSKCGETLVHPVKRLPVKSLAGKLVATQVVLANGKSVWGLIGNVDPENAQSTEHFLTLSLLKDNKWFILSRYHDFDYRENGPESLALFLGLPVNEVFPIAYDISRYVVGDSAVLSGTIPKEPREKLTEGQIIALALQ